MNNLILNNIQLTFAAWDMSKSSSSFPSKSTFGFNLYIITGIVCVVLFFVILSYWNKISGGQGASPEKKRGKNLFDELCAAHQFSNHEKSALKQIASHCNYAEPSYLFIEPSWTDQLSSASENLQKAGQAMKPRIFG